MSDKSKQHHSIQEMNFDVQFNSEKEAFRFQQKINYLIKEQLLDITEEVLNDLVPQHQIIKVNSLIIDLETLPLNHLEHDLPDLYKYKLREALEALLFRLKGVTYSAVDDAEASSPDAGLSKVLSIFLKTGTLPWWAKNTWQAYINQHKEYANEKLEITKIFEIVFQSTPELLVQLVERSQDDHQVLYRLADQIPNYQLFEVIKSISPEKGDKLKKIVLDFEKISSPKFLSLSQSQVRVIVWQVIFLNWDMDDEQEIIKHVLDKLLTLANHQIQQVEEYFLQLSIDKLSLNTHLAASLQTLTTTASKEKLQKEIYSSEEKIKRLLLQLMSSEEADLVMAYAKNVHRVIKHLSRQQVWESILDYLWDNKQTSLNVDALSAEVLPTLTHNWEQAAKQLQTNTNEYSVTLKEFSKDVIEASQSISAPEQVKSLLTQILDSEQVDWFWKYGNTLTKLLETTPHKVWEILVENLWELRKQTFTKQHFLKTTFPVIWKKLIPTVAIPSNIPALQNQKMWAKPPKPIIEQLSNEISEVRDVSNEYWTRALSPNPPTSNTSQGLSQELQDINESLLSGQSPLLTGETTNDQSINSSQTNSSQEEEYNTQDIKKTEMTQALDDGKIAEFIEQVLPGQSQWMAEYIHVLTEVFKVDEKVAWEQIIDFLWENRQAGFERTIFLTNSLAVITESITSSLDTYESWQFKKAKVQEVIAHYPEFTQTNDDIILASLYQSVNQTRKKLFQRNVTPDLVEVIDKIFTKGILPAVAQVQRSLASTVRQPIISLEETIATLIETAFNNQYYNLAQLLDVNILQRFIEQTSEEFVYTLINQVIETDDSIYIPDNILLFLKSIPAFGNWHVIKDRQVDVPEQGIHDVKQTQKETSSKDNDGLISDDQQDDTYDQEQNTDDQQETTGDQKQIVDGVNQDRSELYDLEAGKETLENNQRHTTKDQDKRDKKIKDTIGQEATLDSKEKQNETADTPTNEKESTKQTDIDSVTDRNKDKRLNVTQDQTDGTTKKASESNQAQKDQEYQSTETTKTDETTSTKDNEVTESNKKQQNQDKTQQPGGSESKEDSEKSATDATQDQKDSELDPITGAQDKESIDQESAKPTKEKITTSSGLTFIESQEIANDLDLLIYYLQYYLIKKQLPANIANPDINHWLQVLKEQHTKNFQYFILSLSTENIDLLAKHTPEIIRWVDDVWRTQVAQQNKPTTEQAQANTREKETYERIKKEIFKSVNEQKQQILDQAIYVNNAGLIILHPYLPRLFEMLGLTEKKVTESKSSHNPQKKKKKTKVVFKGDAEKEKAIYILQYLATKNEEAPEHELVLNKVLCGMEITDPFVSGQVTLTDEEKETCEELLGVVVQNWTILKDSPPDTLRGSFFIREGRLEIKEGNWFLKIEESGVDVLLQHLTWSIGMIKLPWMPKIMNVEWFAT